MQSRWCSLQSYKLSENRRTYWTLQPCLNIFYLAHYIYFCGCWWSITSINQTCASMLEVVYVLLGRAVTEYRWGGSRNILFMLHKFLVLTVKKLSKSGYIYGSYHKIKTVITFLDHPVCIIIIMKALNAFLMIQRQMTLKVYNVWMLHRPRMSHGLLADRRYDCTTLAGLLYSCTQHMGCSVKWTISERAEKDITADALSLCGSWASCINPVFSKIQYNRL